MANLPDVCPKIELPGSKDGFEVCVVSKKERRIPREEWEIMKPRLISFSVTDYTKIKRTFIKYCLNSKCKQQVGMFDDLFLAIDKALQLKGN